MDSHEVTPGKEPVATERAHAALYVSGFNGMVAASHELVVGAQAITAEMLAFWQSRVKEGMVAVQRLLECRSVESAVEIHLDHAKGALQAYLDQSAKIGAAATRSLARPHAIVKPVSEEALAPPA
jgi:hypothetical protein